MAIKVLFCFDVEVPRGFSLLSKSSLRVMFYEKLLASPSHLIITTTQLSYPLKRRSSDTRNRKKSFAKIAETFPISHGNLLVAFDYSRSLHLAFISSTSEFFESTEVIVDVFCWWYCECLSKWNDQVNAINIIFMIHPQSTNMRKLNLIMSLLSTNRRSLKSLWSKASTDTQASFQIFFLTQQQKQKHVSCSCNLLSVIISQKRKFVNVFLIKFHVITRHSNDPFAQL